MVAQAVTPEKIATVKVAPIQTIGSDMRYQVHVLIQQIASMEVEADSEDEAVEEAVMSSPRDFDVWDNDLVVTGVTVVD